MDGLAKIQKLLRFRKWYGKMDAPLKRLNMLYDISVLVTLSAILTDLNNTHWLDFGSLVGAYRCQDVLPFDGKGFLLTFFYNKFID